jgi:hypothetical protein
MINDDGRTSGSGAVFRRAAAASDIAAVLAFWQVAAEDRGRPVDTQGALAALLARDPEALILAVDSGEIVGTIIAGWDPGAHRIWAACGYRRQEEWSRWVKPL